MNCTGRDFAHAALALVGSPFRLHGRDPETGLDCVGLVAAALSSVGVQPDAPNGYQMRHTDPSGLLRFARLNGFTEADGPFFSGDLLLVRTGPAQMHLLIAHDEHGFIHADGRLGRIAVLPAPLRWPLLNHWRLAAHN